MILNGVSNAKLSLKPYILLVGTFEGIFASIIIESGCDTNMVSQEFLSDNKEQPQQKIGKIYAINYHSRAGLEKNVSEAFEHGLLIMAEGTGSYKSSWFVRSARYDILLGIPWYTEWSLAIDFHQRVVKKMKGTETVELQENKTILNVDRRLNTKVKSVSAKGFSKAQKKNQIA